MHFIILVPVNSIFSESKHGSITFPLRSSSFLLKLICKFCGNSNSLNYFVVSNNLFLVENLVRLSYPSYFSEYTILISYRYKYFLGKICLLITSKTSKPVVYNQLLLSWCKLYFAWLFYGLWWFGDIGCSMTTILYPKCLIFLQFPFLE